MKKARKVVVAVVGIVALFLCGIVVVVKQNEMARMRQWGHEIELVSNLSSDWVQAHIDEMVAIGRRYGMNRDQTLEYGKIIFGAGFTDETAMVGYEESLRRAWELGIPVSEAARQISREMHVLGYNQDDLQRRTLQLTAYSNEILNLSQSIADMTGASALQLKVLLGLDRETFERLQAEAPETLTMMLLRRVGDVTEDISPEFRPYTIEAILYEQLGIRDPTAIDELRDAIMEDRIGTMETVLGELAATPTPTRHPTSGWETIYDPDTASSVDYPTDKWQPDPDDERVLLHLSLPCALVLRGYPMGMEPPLADVFEQTEKLVPVRLGRYMFERSIIIARSAAAPYTREIAYYHHSGDLFAHIVLVALKDLYEKPDDVAICQQDAEAVIATLTIR